MNTVGNQLSLGAAVAVTIAIVFAGASVRAQDGSEQADPTQFTRGATAWANNCARCHNMRDPGELPDDQWRAVVTHMRIRAGLTGAETRDILMFLQESN